MTLGKKCPYSELFWSVFSRIWTEYGEILHMSPYSVQIMENMDQSNSKYKTFSRNMKLSWSCRVALWCSITTAQLHSTKPEVRFCVGSNPARGVSEIRDGEDFWQWSWLERSLNAFRRSTILQKQFIIITIIIIIIKKTCYFRSIYVRNEPVT